MRLAIIALWLVGLAACKKKQCTDVTTDLTGGVSYRWKGCSDDLPRALVCTPGGAQFTCACELDGKGGKTFQVPSTGMVKTDLVTPEQARDGCGWDFAP
jgi:hypothetical protein